MNDPKDALEKNEDARWNFRFRFHGSSAEMYIHSKRITRMHVHDCSYVIGKDYYIQNKV